MSEAAAVKAEPKVWGNYTQAELDAQYNQMSLHTEAEHEHHRAEKVQESARVRAKLAGQSLIDVAYGPSEAERLDIFKADKPNAPVQIFFHGGAWKGGKKSDVSFPAESFVAKGATFIAVNYERVPKVSLDEQVRQARAAVAWAYSNAREFGGDPNRIFVSGHSSGGHVCGMVVVTDWQRDFGLPSDVVKGGAPISGMFDLAPVKLSWRNSYVALDEAAVERLSPIRHIPNRAIPLVVGYGTGELAEFQRQSREFAAAWRKRGYPCAELALENLKHYAVNYEFNKPQGKLLSAIFAQMNL
ncbi:MAG TPA: alpha/beta hydrolase [Afipia sp.]